MKLKEDFYKQVVIFKFLPQVFPRALFIVDSDLLPVFVVCEDGGGGGGVGGLRDVLVCQLVQVIQLPGELQSLSSHHINSFRKNIECPCYIVMMLCC